MTRKVILAGLAGGIVLTLWTFVFNGVFGFRNRIDMKQVPNERQVYELLKENVASPGRYLCNPELTAAGAFPDGEPAFGILYGGVGHEAAGRYSLVQLLLAFGASLAGAWLLSCSSRRVMARYSRRVLFFSGIGVLVALFSDLGDVGIGAYPASDALLLAAHTVAVWTAMGFAVAWRMKPAPAASPV